MCKPKIVNKNIIREGMEEFRNGLWMRVIAWPEDEVFALAKREKGAKKQPAPSVVTFVKEGLPILLRGTEMGYEDCTQYSYATNDLGDGFGVFLRIPAGNVRVCEWWFTGVGKSGPDEHAWEQGKRYDNGSGEFHQLWDPQRADILRKLDELRAVLGADKCLPVNEALVSYRLVDVCGLLINKRSVKSLARAAGFLKGVLKSDEALISFYSYDATRGQIVKENLEEMKSAKHCRKFNKKVLGGEVVFSVCVMFSRPLSSKITRASTRRFGKATACK